MPDTKTTNAAMTKPADQIAKARRWDETCDRAERFYAEHEKEMNGLDEFQKAANFAISERQAVIEDCCRAVCYLCAGKHTNYNPQPIISEEYHGIFHVALDAKTDIEKNRTMARCGAAAIRSME